MSVNSHVGSCGEIEMLLILCELTDNWKFIFVLNQVVYHLHFTLNTYVWKKIKCLELAILQPFLAIFFPSIFISFTELRFRSSFWGAYQVKIIIGLKATTWITTLFVNCVFQFCKKKNVNSSFKNGHFLIISGQFYGYYIDIFHETEIQTVILRC